jgi:hypothetical protein
MNQKERQLRYCYTNVSWEISRLKDLEGKGCRKAQKHLELALKELEKEIHHIHLGDVPNPMWKEE